MSSDKSYVVCPELITSPAPPAGFTAATGLGANEPCGAKCEVINAAPVMQFICRRGHHFIAANTDVRTEAPGV